MAVGAQGLQVLLSVVLVVAVDVVDIQLSEGLRDEPAPFTHVTLMLDVWPAHSSLQLPGVCPALPPPARLAADGGDPADGA
jgi:hypothetical protein